MSPSLHLSSAQTVRFEHRSPRALFYAHSSLFDFTPHTRRLTIVGDTNFSSITRESGNGSVLEAEIDESVYVAIAGATFKQCSARNGSGGALALTLLTQASLIVGDAPEMEFAVSTTTFDNCSASEMGGALFLNVSGIPSSDYFLFRNFDFKRCNATNGTSALITTSIPDLLRDYTPWIDFIRGFKRVPNRFVLWNPNETAGVDVYSSLPSQFLVSRDGNDTAECGGADAPCRTFKGAIDSRGGLALVVKFMGGLHRADNHSFIIMYNFEVTGEADANKMVSPSAVGGSPIRLIGDADLAMHGFTLTLYSSSGLKFNAPIFTTVSTGQLQFYDMHITAGPPISADSSSLIESSSSSESATTSDSSSTVDSSSITDHSDSSSTSSSSTDSSSTTDSSTLYSSLINATDGRLHLSNVTFSNIELYNSPLLDISTSQKSFTIASTTTFTNITRWNGNGSILQISFDSSRYVELTHAYFSGCRCLDSNSCGGAIYLSLTAGSSTGALSFSNLRFDNTNQATSGTCLFFIIAGTTAYNFYTINWAQLIEGNSGDGNMFVIVSEKGKMYEASDFVKDPTFKPLQLPTFYILLSGAALVLLVLILALIVFCCRICRAPYRPKEERSERFDTNIPPS